MSEEKRDALSVEKRADGVFVLRMDLPGESVNTLKDSFAQDFAEVFASVERDPDLKAIVFTSGKKGSFIAGADINMLKAATSVAAAESISRSGQEAMERIRKFKVPVVAAIDGVALGGGLEVAMACHGRVASDSSRTKLGLPECQLGLLPGACGTQALPRLVPIQTALDLLLTGKQLDAKRAKKAGLVDEVVPAPILIEVAAAHALKLAKSHGKEGGPFDGIKRLLEPGELQDAALTDNPLGRKVLFDQAKKTLLRKTRGNYPAQERILDVVKVGLEEGWEAGLRAEAKAFGELVMSSEASQLMNIFFATTAMKKDNGTDDPSVKARPVTKVGMLGAGLMGQGIAYVTTNLAKIPVRLKDRDAAGVGRGLKAVNDIVQERVKRRRMSPREAQRRMNMVTGTTDYSGFKDCEVVIEAVFESLDLKHQMVKDVEALGREDVIFASNTSSIPITEIAQASAHPETVIGMHYFSPVHKMPLLEIIVTEKTADWVTATCVALGKKQGKTVIVVNDGTGFYTSRILGPMMNEAAYILSEGVRVEHIDEALVSWGFPVGPITLLDEVGIDVAAKVGPIMQEAFGERLKAPASFDRLIADKRYGRKNKRGFYVYDDSKKGGKKPVDGTVYEVLGITPTKELPAEEIAMRCALQFVNEAALCFGEGILRSARDGDIGAIFGLGFPPFRGGPFRYVDQLGAEEVVKRLSRFRDRLGDRFRPAPVLVDMAKNGLTFFGDKKVEPGQHKEKKVEEA